MEEKNSPGRILDSYMCCMYIIRNNVGLKVNHHPWILQGWLPGPSKYGQFFDQPIIPQDRSCPLRREMYVRPP